MEEYLPNRHISSRGKFAYLAKIRADLAKPQTRRVLAYALELRFAGFGITNCGELAARYGWRTNSLF